MPEYSFMVFLAQSLQEFFCMRRSGAGVLARPANLIDPQIGPGPNERDYQQNRARQLVPQAQVYMQAPQNDSFDHIPHTWNR